ncbi:MAG: CcmD family protein [Sphingobacteriaceae bacterium]
MKKKIALLALLCAGSLAVLAQPVSVEMADGLRSSGMIYVVVSIMSVILVGILGYLFSIDKKVSKLEKNSTKS